MSVTIRWNPDWERDLKREVVKNATRQYRAALARVTCPDHGAHPTIEAQGEQWSIRRCCEKAEALAFDAIRKVNES